jgi:hypothetical protein
MQLIIPAAKPPEPTIGSEPPAGDRFRSDDIYPWYDRWASHPGQGLTLGRLFDIYWQAEWGYPAEQCDMFEDIVERDGHLRSNIENRIDAVAGKEWIVQAGGDAPADHKAAELLEQALRPRVRARGRDPAEPPHARGEPGRLGVHQPRRGQGEPRHRRAP